MGRRITSTDRIVTSEHFPDCELCPKLCKNSLNVCMAGEGPSHADLMIVGEAPGGNEDEMNRPFVGRAGEFLRDELMVAAKIPESKVRFTNAVRCHPPKNKTPTATEIRKCRPYLELEIKRIKPKVIVGMGNVPLATFLSRFYKGAKEEGVSRKSESIVSGISVWRGKVIWLREFNCWFIPTFHPSYCMRNEQGRGRSTYSTELAVSDLKKAWELCKSPRYTPSQVETTIVDSSKEFKTLMLKLQKLKAFAFDIETGVNYDNPNIPRIIGASFAWEKHIGYYVSWDLIESYPIVRELLYDILGSSKHLKAMHNGAYEIRVLRYNNIPIHDRYFDTMIAAHMVDENFRKGLKDLTWIHTDFGGYDVSLEKYKQENKIKADYSKIPYEMLSEYGALDAVATWYLYKVLSKQMDDENLTPLFKKVSMPVRRVMSDAEYVGIYVDAEQAELVKSNCESAKGILEELIYEEAGTEFNIKSPKQLQDILYSKMGFVPLKVTKTGYSTDAESIEYIATQRDSDIAKHLSDLSYITTMLGTHIGQALAFRWEEDSRIHGWYNLTGTVTGRASCSNPSLQNVPADKLVRSIYTATPGNDLIDADLKSAELATIAAISGEELFLDAFENGLDPHAATYRRMFDLPDSYKPTREERRSAKTINFGLIYGISAVGLARRLGVSIEESQSFMDRYFSSLPNIHKWMLKQQSLVRKQGYVVSVFNRKRRLPMGKSDDMYDISRAERQAMNAPIQSGAADYAYIGLIRLSRLIKKKNLKSKIVHTVHDCGLTDTPRKETKEMLSLFHEAFETPVKALPVKMQIEIEVSKCWGEHNESRLEGIFEKLELPKIKV